MSKQVTGGGSVNSSTTPIPLAYRKMQEAQFFFSRLGRKPPADTMFTADQVHRFHLSAFLSAAKGVISLATFELQGGWYVKKWRDTLSGDDQDFLTRVLGQRDQEIHGRGIRVEEQPWPFEPHRKLPGRLAELVSERMFVIGERKYGASFVALRVLGLLASLLAHVETATKMRGK